MKGEGMGWWKSRHIFNKQKKLNTMFWLSITTAYFLGFVSITFALK